MEKRSVGEVMRDIQNRDDILLIMQNFYKKLLADDKINYIFTTVANIDLDAHFPILVNFWDSMLFHSQTYQSNAMLPHLVLAKKTPFSKEHFYIWLRYLEQSVNELFQGEKADEMKSRANAIAAVMRIKVNAI